MFKSISFYVHLGERQTERLFHDGKCFRSFTLCKYNDVDDVQKMSMDDNNNSRTTNKLINAYQLIKYFKK